MANKSLVQRAKDLANVIFKFGRSPLPLPATPPARAIVAKQPGSQTDMALGLYGLDGVTSATPSVPGQPAPHMPTEEHVSAARVQQFLLSRYNPIRGLTPQRLANALEQFDIGYLRDASLIWSKIRDRDDQIASVAIKRELKPTDMPWEILAIDESAEAQAQKEALEDFYNNITVTHCIEGNTKGGVQLLIQQMMLAVGDKYAVHEIVWKPEPDLLTAEFRYVPVWFFEARTGKLRFLPYELAITGIDLEQAGWVVHTAKGLFQSSSIAYLFKQLALKTWVNYNEKFGMPFLHGKTNDAQGSDAWNSFRDALMGFSSDGAILTSLGAELEAINVSAGTTIPMESLLDRMDRAMGRIWNGGDLHSMSSSKGSSAGLGSNPQMEGQNDLAKSDAERITETLNFYVDRWVLKYKFGVDKPLAKFILQPAKDQNVDQDLKVDEFLVGILPSGTLGVQDILERYQRSRADDGEETLDNPGQQALDTIEQNEQALGAPNAAPKPIANIKQFNVTSTKVVADELAAVLAPLRARILDAQQIRDPEVRKLGLQKIVDDLPRYLKAHARSPELISTISDTLATALVGGATDAAKQTNGHGRNGSAHYSQV